ncbi:MAG: DUF1097 domain-containing protein [Lysobacterales bacterium]
MDLLLSYGISVGVLAGLWVIGSSETGIYTWPTFVSWACYYAIVGTLDTKPQAVSKTIAGNLSGLLWGIIAVVVAGVLPIPYAVALMVCLICIGMCVQAHLSFLSYIPAAFCGAAIFFGVGATVNVWWNAAIALVAGALLGWLSQVWGDAMARKPEKLAE